MLVYASRRWTISRPLHSLVVSAALILLGMTANSAVAQTSGPSVTGTFSGLVYSRATQTFNSVLTLTNTGTGGIPSPVSIIISTGNSAVTVAGASDGSTDVVNLPGGSLVGGASANIVVAFVDPTRVAFTPTVTGISASGFTQATITSSQGGTIVASGTGNPLNGTQIVIPANALGDPTETITIGYTNVLPGPLSASAAAAGIVAISPNVITLNKSGTTPLQNDLQVTIPYSAAALGPTDYPMVGYWSPALQQYEPAQVISVNRAAGLVTFSTKHFSSWAVFTLPGLGKMLNGATPWASQLLNVNTGFSPATDGFEIENFSTGLAGGVSAGSNGVCFGVASYAAWYFQQEKPSTQGLYTNYQATGDPGVLHLPEEDAVAREIVAATYADTVHDFRPQYGNNDAQTAFAFIFWMTSTNSPQLAYLNNSSGTDAHSVLVYSWSTSSLSFSVYDPNVAAPQLQPPSLNWTLPSAFASWTSAGNTYTQILFDAYGTHYEEDTLQAMYQRAKTGPPETAWRFGGVDVDGAAQGLTVTSPLGSTPGTYPYGTNSVGTRSHLNVQASGGTVLQFTWTCPDCDPAQGTWYLHVLQNDQPITPIQVTSGQTVSVTTSALVSNGGNELIAFVSTDSTSAPVDQLDILHGYIAFYRAELIPSVPPSEVFITVQGTISVLPTVRGQTEGPLSIGQPFTLTIDWFPFVQSNEPGWNNNCVGVNPFTSYSVCYGASLAYGGNPPPNNFTTLTVGSQTFSTVNGDSNYLILGGPTGGDYTVMIAASGFDRDVGVGITSSATPFPDPFQTSNINYSSSAVGTVSFGQTFWQLNTNNAAYNTYGNAACCVNAQITRLTITSN